jgi:hypothetical protein
MEQGKESDSNTYWNKSQGVEVIRTTGCMFHCNVRTYFAKTLKNNNTMTNGMVSLKTKLSRFCSLKNLKL